MFVERAADADTTLGLLQLAPMLPPHGVEAEKFTTPVSITAHASNITASCCSFSPPSPTSRLCVSVKKGERLCNPQTTETVARHQVSSVRESRADLEDPRSEAMCQGTGMNALRLRIAASFTQRGDYDSNPVCWSTHQVRLDQERISLRNRRRRVSTASSRSCAQPPRLTRRPRG